MTENRLYIPVEQFELILCGLEKLALIYTFTFVFSPSLILFVVSFLILPIILSDYSSISLLLT
jgi:hypothetical protein